MQRHMVTISIIDGDYRKWVEDLGKRFRQSQIKAAVSVNSEMLRFYWELGRDIVEMQAEKRWGDKLMQNLSKDLQNAIPNSTGLTVRNIYYCKKFYRLYNQQFKIVPQVGAQLGGQSESTIVPQYCGTIILHSLGTSPLHHGQMWGRPGYGPFLCAPDVREWMEPCRIAKLDG